MIGLAVVFHVLSGVALAALVYAFLRVKAERDFLQHLIDSVPGTSRPKRIWVGRPAVLLNHVASALRVPIVGPSSSSAPQDLVRIEFGPIMELFLRRGVSLLRWTSHTEQGQSRICGLEVVLPVSPGSNNRALSGPDLAAAELAIRKALGGAVDVKVVLGPP